MSDTPTPPTAPRKAPSRSNRRRPNTLAYILGALLVGLAAEGAYVAMTSPRFEIERVEVTGLRNLTAKEVLDAAAIPPRANLFRLRTRQSAKQVGRIPRIRRVEIHRRLPNRVFVRVEERRPTALLAAGTSYYLVDNTGTPYAKMGPKGVKLPVLRLEPPPPVTLGAPLKGEMFETGMKALPAVRGLMAQGGSLWVDPRLNLCLNRGDFSVRLGQPEMMDRKIKLLKGLMAAEPRLMETARYVDLSAPENPAMMPRDPDDPEVASASAITRRETD